MRDDEDTVIRLIEQNRVLLAVADEERTIARRAIQRAAETCVIMQRARLERTRRGRDGTHGVARSPDSGRLSTSLSRWSVGSCRFGGGLDRLSDRRVPDIADCYPGQAPPRRAL
jgi:hypothetical protein